MKLADYTEAELKAELQRRTNEEFEKSMKTLPLQFYPYEETDEITLNSEETDSQLFIAHIDDGCEGMVYLVELRHDDFDGCEEDNEILENSIRHAILTRAKEEDWIDNLSIYDINISEVGRYGYSFLKLVKTEEEE